MNAPPTIFDQFNHPMQRGDPWGGAYDPPRDPLSDAKGAKRDAAGAFYREIPITFVASSWSIDTIRSALQRHKVGEFQESALLAESIFGDDRVQATLGSRTGGLFSQPIQFHRRGIGKKYSHRALKAWKRDWRKILPLHVASELMRWTILMGFSLAETRWDTSVTPWLPRIQPWNPYYDIWRPDLHKHQLSTLDGPVAAIPGTGKWIVYAPHGQYRGWIQGCIRSIAETWYIKRLAWRDWARFNERHGLPIIKAFIPAAGDVQQKNNFVASLQGMGQETTVACPVNVDASKYDLELLEARDRAWESFPSLIDRADRSIVLPILWQNLTTEVKEGSYAAARMHGDIRQQALEFDNETLAECIYQQVARPWALFNFGDPDVAPYTCWDVRPVEDFVAKTDVLVKFANAMNQLRQAGLAPKHIERLAARFGLSLTTMTSVDPMQVEARLAAATGKLDDDKKPESVRALRLAWRDVRREAKRVSEIVERYREAA